MATTRPGVPSQISSAAVVSSHLVVQVVFTVPMLLLLLLLSPPVAVPSLWLLVDALANTAHEAQMAPAANKTHTRHTEVSDTATLATSQVWMEGFQKVLFIC